MGFIKEFKEFAMKGNVIDLAVGVIIGAAFGKIVDSIVNDLIMPLVSAVIGTPDFTKLYIVLKGDVPKGSALDVARKVDGSVIFAYGNFLTILVNFILLALVIFILIKAVNKMKAKEAAAAVSAPDPGPSSTDKLLMEIRDSLKK
jgi:large conductance mechanosensitive channel